MNLKSFIFFSALSLTIIGGLSSCGETEKRNPENSSHNPPQEPDSEYPGSKLYDSIHGDTMENRGNHH
jgi:hypothetical protein